jgi:indole-3-glycerol phosphate synthase
MSDFADALLGAPLPVIMELKRRSAHGLDLFRERAARTIADEYRAYGAPCLSVVTGPWFGGHDDLLREVAAATDLPILKKDFVATARQVADAKAMGASAILLTAELLPAVRVRRLVETSLEHGLTPVVEVVREAHLRHLAHADECVIAIANKQIRMRERDPASLERGLALLPAARRTGARCVVSASGIETPSAAARLLAAGFDGLLVGTALLTADDPATWLSELRIHRHAECPQNDQERALNHVPTN